MTGRAYPVHLAGGAEALSRLLHDNSSLTAVVCLGFSGAVAESPVRHCMQLRLGKMGLGVRVMLTFASGCGDEEWLRLKGNLAEDIHNIHTSPLAERELC